MMLEGGLSTSDQRRGFQALGSWRHDCGGGRWNSALFRHETFFPDYQIIFNANCNCRLATAVCPMEPYAEPRSLSMRG